MNQAGKSKPTVYLNFSLKVAEVNLEIEGTAHILASAGSV